MKDTDTNIMAIVLNPSFALSDLDLKALVTASTDACETRLHFGPVGQTNSHEINSFISSLIPRIWNIVSEDAKVLRYHVSTDEVLSMDEYGDVNPMPCRVMVFSTTPVTEPVQRKSKLRNFSLKKRVS